MLHCKTYNLTIGPARGLAPTIDLLKLQPDRAEGVNLITRHDASSIWVGNSRFTHSLLVPWQGEVQRWPPARADELGAEHFEAVLSWQPELVIFGSGSRLRFVAPALLRGLIERRIGVETMDTAAACRTYNVLAAEGRTVLAALLLAPQTIGGT
jgi:uncharacterized protein